MMEETKNVIYMSLDLLNSISKTSETKSNFMAVDETILKKVKEELFDLMRDKPSPNEEKRLIYKSSNPKKKEGNKKIEVIGLLPSILIDKEKFPKNEDIAKLAEKSLNLEIPFWGKRSRNEIIGTLIAMIATKKEDELDLFFEAWKEFTQKESEQIKKWENSVISNETNNTKRPDFVDVWLEFFNHYKG